MRRAVPACSRSNLTLCAMAPRSMTACAVVAPVLGGRPSVVVEVVLTGPIVPSAR
ncbi:Uncharacterised protein [Mycobacteroides abscessus subsp. abscessus]|nr:Uncharacterised protein [Mycobacteroides abscessus subsp. abscessus]